MTIVIRDQSGSIVILFGSDIYIGSEQLFVENINNLYAK